MTNAEIVLKALRDLETADMLTQINASDVALQARRNGWQITPDKTRNVLKHLVSTGNAECVKTGNRYWFRMVKP